jgi:peptidoglycan-associated lipoprotein
MLRKKALLSVILLGACAKSGSMYNDINSSYDNTSKSKEYTKEIYFDFDKYNLKSQYNNALQSQIDYIINNKNNDNNSTVFVKVEGHADKRGSAEYNLALGLKRAETVKNEISKGIRASNVNNVEISTVSFGETKPAVNENKEEAYALNRRTETTIK